MKLAIFDFDGTITDRDSFVDFIIFCHGLSKTFIGFVVNSPCLILMLLKFYVRGQAKENVWTYFFRHTSEENLNQLAEKYVNERLSMIVRPAARQKLDWHKSQGHRVAIVSASFENYLKFWTQKEGFDLIATQGEVKEGKLTGKFACPNCYGAEKVRRIKEKYNLKDFEFIYAYGDSKGDLPLKEIAQEFHYKPFTTAL